MIDRGKTSLNGKNTTLRLALRVTAVFLLFITLIVGVTATGQGRRKVSGALQKILELRAIGGSAGLAAAQGYSRSQGVEIKGPDERLVTVIEGGGNLKNQIDSLGGTLQAKYLGYWQVELPLANISALAQAARVSYIRLPLVASSFPSPDAASNPQTPPSTAAQGTIISEGVALIGADQLHEQGVTGRGVKVGIIDLGFAGLDKIIESGELPENVVAWNGLGTNLAPGKIPPCKQVTAKELSDASGNEVHGTAVAEIVHDMAPDAELHLFLVSTGVELGRALTKTIQEGIRVINHSVGWYNTNFYDGTGFIGDIVRTAHQNNIFWVNSAGNDALTHYECTFQDDDGDLCHDEMIQLTLEKPAILTAFLTWDAWPSTDEDFDLFLHNSQDTALRRPDATSLNRQNGTEPKETIFFNAEKGTYKLRIEWVGDGDPPNGRRMELFLSPWWMKVEPNVAGSSLPTPANSATAFVVGAVSAANWEVGELQPFSSQGPTNGNLHKPELVGPDCVSTATYGTASSASVSGVDHRFGGTSAAAPHVAGTVALLLSEDSSRTLEDLNQLLTERAKRIADSTVDQVGAGRLACGGVLPLPDLLITSAKADPKEAEPGNTVHIRVQVKNSGKTDVQGSFWVVLGKKTNETHNIANYLVTDLEVDEEKEVILQWNVLKDQASGEEQLVVVVNPYADVAEEDETNNRRELDVTILVRPALEVQPQELEFRFQKGGTAPPAQKVTISNIGRGILNWKATADLDWLQFDTSQGSLGTGQSDQPHVSIGTFGLKAGNYQASITIADENAKNSPAQVSVILTVVPPPPMLKVSPQGLDFEAQEGESGPDPQSLTISNDGGQPLNWTATTDAEAGWLELSSINGTVQPGESTTVHISADISGLSAGTYQETITITAPDAENSPAQVAVTLTVEPPSAVLKVIPEQLNFEAQEGGDDPDLQSVTISNDGRQPLNWTTKANAGASWLNLTPSSGTVQPGESTKVDVSADISGLSAGTYQEAIVVTAPDAENSPVQVAVILTVDPPPPVLNVTPQKLNFEAQEGGEDPDLQSLTISNDGGQPLNWTATTDAEAGWLELSPASGTVDAGESTTVQVSADISGLSAGTYQETITITAPDAEKSPEQSTVTLTVNKLVPLVITAIDFPTRIPCESPVQGTVEFADNGDINRVTFEVVEAIGFEPFEFNPKEASSFNFDSSTDTGSFNFNITCNIEQEVKLRVFLFDTAGNKSDSWEFSFECSLREGNQ